MNGIINFFKPKGMTSHQAVNFLRKQLNMKKIGHTGTLDPNVSGVLPLCIGKGTKVSEYLLESDKEYIGEITLGIKTDSYDSDGVVTGKSDKIALEEDIRQVFSEYIGEIEQIPPMYSALKHKGQKLYDLARQGIEVERKPRIVTIYENEILSIDGNKIKFRLKCSKGTYIRSICHDVGEKLGTYGYMSYLIRTESDIFKIADSIGKETIENMTIEEIKNVIIPLDRGLLCLERIDVYGKDFNGLAHGLKVKSLQLDKYEVDKEFRIYHEEKFVGVGTIIKFENESYLKMKKVLLV